MIILQKDAANRLLSSVGMVLDEWNKIANPRRPLADSEHFLNCRAPRDSLELYSFSQFVADWLPHGEWYLFQIDNSTQLAPDQDYLIRCLLGLDSQGSNLIQGRSFLFEFGPDENINNQTRLKFATLIFYFLMFELHGNAVSSRSIEGEILALQDGYIYFISQGDSLGRASQLVKQFEDAPLSIPDWVGGLFP